MEPAAPVAGGDLRSDAVPERQRAASRRQPDPPALGCRRLGELVEPDAGRCRGAERAARAVDRLRRSDVRAANSEHDEHDKREYPPTHPALVSWPRARY